MIRNSTGAKTEPRFAPWRSSGAARPGRRAALAFAVAFAAAILGGPSVVSAQLCSWGGTPVLPPPDVDFLNSEPGGLRAPARLTVDSQDNIYVTDPTTGAVIVKDVYGAIVAVRHGMGVPLAIAVDAFDNIFLGDESVGRVDIFDPSWQQLGRLGQGAGEFVIPTDLAIDPDPGFGRVYVTDGGAHQVRVYGPDGSLIRVIGGHGTAPGLFDFPAAVWVSVAGRSTWRTRTTTASRSLTATDDSFAASATRGTATGSSAASRE